MGTLHLPVYFEDWLSAITTVFTTIALTSTFRSFLRRLHTDHSLPALKELAPHLSTILYIIGFKLAIDLAPLSGKIEIWTHHIFDLLAVFIFLSLTQRAALLAIKFGAIHSQTTETLQKGFLPLLRNVITLFVFLSGGIMILKHFTYDVMSLVTALGVGSLAVGLAAKDTLSNMISGFILIIDRNLSPGDRIQFAGATGDLLEIGLRSTRIKMTDGNLLIVPNSDLVNSKILNLSLPSSETSYTVQFRVPLNVPFQKGRQVCLETLQQIPRVSKIKPTWVHLLSLDEGHQLLQVGFWVNRYEDAGSITSEFNESVLVRFEKEGIPLLPPPPGPIRFPLVSHFQSR